MRRRQFIALTGAGTALALTGCARSFVAEAPPEDGGSADAALTSDAAVATDAGMGAFVIAAGFSVLLDDVSCSGHDHECNVSAGTYATDEPILFNSPGSHSVAFRPSELMQLASGAQLAFATVGPGPGHGHCGMAWRSDLRPAPSVDRVDACAPITPVGMPQGVCILHPAT